MLIILPVFPVHAEDITGFEIRRIDIDVDIDTNGISLVTEKIILVNTSSDKRNSVEMSISGREIWNVKAFENEDEVLTTKVTQEDDVTFIIRIEVDIEPEETKNILLQYVLNSGNITIGKFDDFYCIGVAYSFSEFKYLDDNDYPLSVRFRAPKGFFITSDLGNYSSDDVGSDFLDQYGIYHEQEYISLVFKKKPEKKIITVFLRNMKEIKTYRTKLEETLDFSEGTLNMIIWENPDACEKLGSFFRLLPYRGKNAEIAPSDFLEFKSNASCSWLESIENVGPFRVGYPLHYFIGYDLDDYDFKNPFFTVIKREISETEYYILPHL